MASDQKYVPKTAFGKWMHERLPIAGLMYESAIVFPTPRNLNYFWTFGGILMFMLVIMILTGVLLVMNYKADAGLAFWSVESIMRDSNAGYFIRYLHANGASFFFIAVYIHIFRGMYYGSYKAPREVLWILGVVIFLLMMATAFMGYVLPWGQMSLWGATVITNFFTALPIGAESITQALWGGFAVGDNTLNRLFSLHYLMPFMIFGVVILHIWALHVPGNNNPTGLNVQSKKDTLPFHPYYTVKDIFAIVVFLIVMCYFVFYMPNWMGHPDNYIKANPQVTPAHIVPEWYFLPFYAILRAIPDKLMGFIAMIGAVGILLFLPWLDRSRVRSGTYRPLFRAFFWIFVFVCLGLGVMGAKTPEGINIIISQVLTFCYFAYFIIVLPLLSILEKPDPLPISIADSVLEGKAETS